MKRQFNPDYKPLRAREYLPVGEQLGLIIKVLIQLRDQGVDLGECGEELINSTQAVKDKYKKKHEG